MELRLDIGGCLATRIGAGGLEPNELEQAFDDHAQLGEQLAREHAEVGAHAHFDIGRLERDARAMVAFSERARSRFGALIQLGIGGSVLGNVAVHTALPGDRNVAILDNLDPESLQLLRAPLGKALIHIVSKSGNTTETLAKAMIVVDQLQSEVGERWRENLVITTDTDGGALRQFAVDEGLRAFTLPTNLGGRFSYLSPVGLLSLAFAGRHVDALAGGARAALEAGLKPRSAALAYALLLQRFYERGRTTPVLWPYADSLMGLSLWWRQLVAESLGKRHDLDGREVRVGPTPLTALGVGDQHSVLQLFTDGPNDKWFAMVDVEAFRKDLTIPSVLEDRDGFDFLVGKSLSQSVLACSQATRFALQQAGRPVARWLMPQVDERALGQLLMTFLLATSYAGKLFHVNPYDQPGVETCKRAVFAQLGREGYGSAAEVAAGLEADPQWVLG